MSNSILDTIVGAVMNNNKDKTHVIIAIDGPSASGKSAFANHITKSFDCNVFHMDDFFLPADRKTKERLAVPGGNVDWERFKETVMEKIITDQPFTYETYNCKTGEYTTTDVIQPKKLSIVEGVYSMHPELIKYYDYTIFLDVRRPKQLERLTKRSNAGTLAKFKNEWIPLEDKYFDAYNGRANAKFSFDTTKAF